MRYGPREGPSDYFHPEFVPIFLDEQTETVRKASMDLCGNNLACIYDYIAKSSEKFALESKAFKENADETNAALSTCGFTSFCLNIWTRKGFIFYTYLTKVIPFT